MKLRSVMPCLLLLLGAQAARATQTVSSPLVNEGAWKLEARYGFEHRDERSNTLRQLYHGEYGFTRWYAQRYQVRLNKTSGDQLDLDRLEWDHKFQLFHAEEDGFDGALRLRLGKVVNRGAADFVRLDGLWRKRSGAFAHKANLLLGHEAGEDARDGLRLQTSWQTVYGMGSGPSAGLEYFGDFGRLTELSGYAAQAHQLGPVVNGKVNETLAVEVGYLAGISAAAPDGVVKVIFKWGF